MSYESLKTINTKAYSDFIANIPAISNYRSIESRCELLIKKRCPDQKRPVKRCGTCKDAIEDQMQMSKVDGFRTAGTSINVYSGEDYYLVNDLQSSKGELSIDHNNGQVEVAFQKT